MPLEILGISIPHNYAIGPLYFKTKCCFIRKNNKSKSSYKLVTVLSVFAKIFLIVDHLKENHIMPPFQLWFQSGLGCFHALRSPCNIVGDTEAFGGSLVLEHTMLRMFLTPLSTCRPCWSCTAVVLVLI